MDGLTEDEIAAKLEDLVKANDKIRRENELYDSYVSKMLRRRKRKRLTGGAIARRGGAQTKRTKICLTFCLPSRS